MLTATPAGAGSGPPVRIEVLGVTPVLIGGEEAAVNRQDMWLLASLAAQPGRQLDQSRAEWAGVEWAPRSFSSSLYRLRKVMGTTSVLKRFGQTMLNTELVVTDLAEFRELPYTAAGFDDLASAATRVGRRWVWCGAVRCRPCSTPAPAQVWIEGSGSTRCRFCSPRTRPISPGVPRRRRRTTS